MRWMTWRNRRLGNPSVPGESRRLVGRYATERRRCKAPGVRVKLMLPLSNREHLRIADAMRIADGEADQRIGR